MNLAQDHATLNVSPVTSKDVDLLRNISLETFTETFAEANTGENMQQYIQQNFGIDQLSEQVNNPHSSFFLLQSGSATIGYLKVNFAAAQTDLEDENSLEIERIYVLKAFQGKNGGQILLQTARQLAGQHHLAYLWLSVWEHNYRAIAFYNKHGFIEFDKHVFKLGGDEQTDLLMKLVLTH